MILLAHGGAGRRSRGARESLYQEGMKRSLKAAEGAKDALGAVVAAISALEKDELFNAGRGSVLAADGRVRMDASLAASDGRSGAVGDTMLAHSAIGAAKLVMEESPHTLLVGAGADDWLTGMGATAPASTKTTDHQKRLWKRWKEGKEEDSLGTVGAVALDYRGRLAAGTSTGGLRGKKEGRVGDSAVPGAGTWCSEECAISFTGDGDAILARSSAARVALSIKSLGQQAILDELEALREMDAPAGCIVLLRSGEHWALRNCPLMNWGLANESDLHVPLATK